MTHPEHDPARSLSHPLVLCALAVWALNDHVLKAHWPGWLSGKLSDVACLIVIPVLVAGAVELWRHARGRPAPARVHLVVAAASAALVMAAINLWAPAARAYELGFAVLQLPLRALAALLGSGGPPDLRPVVLTMDPSDLLTLPAAAIPVWLDRTSSRSAPPRHRPFAPSMDSP